MTYSKYILLITVALGIGLTACNEDRESHDDHEHHSGDYHRITKKAGDIEFFARFEIHESSAVLEGELYVSEKHRPVESLAGSIKIRVNGSVVSQQELVAKQKGIYPFELPYEGSGPMELAVLTDSGGQTEEISLGLVSRYTESDEPDSQDHLVELDKKMQWRFSMVSASVEYEIIPDVASGTGTVRYDPAHYHVITSPVDGQIDTEHMVLIPSAGDRVQMGDRLGAISPSLSSENSWTGLRLAYTQAKEAFYRAQALMENDAISIREYQQREREYRGRKAGYEQLTSGNSYGAKIEYLENTLFLNAIEEGVITESYVSGGRRVQQGDPLISMYNPDRVRVEVLGYRDELRQIDGIEGLELYLNRGERVTLEKDQIQLVSRDTQGDPSGTRTKVVLSVDNLQGALSNNQPVRVRMKGNQGNRVLAVPDDAIFDDDSHKVVFVMHSGDQFERRFIETGGRYGGKTAVLDGLQEGEHVVIQGIYPLHLMTGNVQIDEDHDH